MTIIPDRPSRAASVTDEAVLLAEDVANAAATQAAARVALRVFLAAVTLILLALLLLRYLPPPADVFSPSEAARLSRLDELLARDIAAAKVRHALVTEQVDVGLFGNSRIVHVSAADVADEPRVFNFGVPGSSFRQSLLLLETLADQGKAPRVAVISLDNFLTEIVPPPEYPHAWRRLQVLLNDVAWLWRRGQPRLAAHAIVDALSVEAHTVALSFNAVLARNRAAYLFGSPDMRRADIGFGPDGSRPLEPLARPLSEIDLSVGFVLLPELLPRDLARFAALAERGITVLIYESPVAAAALATVPPQLSEIATARRSDFLAQCGRVALTCVAAPDFSPEGWQDCCHAPAPALGQFIGALIAANRRQ